MKRFISLILVLMMLFSAVGFTVSASDMSMLLSVVSSENGEFLLAGANESDPSKINGEVYGFMGDVDADGEVSVMDATAIQCHLAHRFTLNDVCALLADTDYDGEISIIDATEIQQVKALVKTSDIIGRILYKPVAPTEPPTEPPTDPPTIAPTDTPTEMPTAPPTTPPPRDDSYFPKPTESSGPLYFPSRPLLKGNVLAFDTASAGWKNFNKVYCHIWSMEGNGDIYNWQSKGEACVDNGNGIWYYDLDAKKVKLNPGELYCCIFSNVNGMQTYNLLFDTTCIGDTAYCDGTKYENPVDSSKKCAAAFWSNQDYTKYGPEMCITSSAYVIGTALPKTTTYEELFTEYFTSWEFAYELVFVGKSHQRCVDDVAYSFGFSAEKVQELLATIANEVDIDWDINKSYLESERIKVDSMPAVVEDKLKYELVIDSDSIWGDFNDKVYCHIYSLDDEITFYERGSKEELCVNNNDGTWSYNLKDHGIELNPDVTYQVQFYCTKPANPATPVINFNKTYLDYTYMYNFVVQSFVWEYRGDANNLIEG